MNPPFKLPLRAEEYVKHKLKHYRVIDAENVALMDIPYKDQATYLCQAVNHYQEMKDALEVIKSGNETIIHSLICCCNQCG